MKYILALAVLASASAVELKQKTNQDKLYDEMLLQTEKVLENAPTWNGWSSHMHEFPGTVNQNGNFMDSYERNLPHPFVGNAADDGYYPVDTFTQNMIKNYAIEGGRGQKQKDPAPTGSFYLTKDGARQAAAEVVCTHFKKCGDEAEKFLAFYYEDAWNYYDVNRVGRIDAIGVSQFFRHLTRPLGFIDLQ